MRSANHWSPPLGQLSLVASVALVLATTVLATIAPRSATAGPNEPSATTTDLVAPASADALADKAVAKQSKRNQTIVKVLGFASLLGLVMFLAPALWRKRFPGRTSLLFRYGALSAVLLVLVVNLFSAAVLVLQHTQVAISDSTNPEAALHHASIEAATTHGIKLNALPADRNPISAAFESADYDGGAEGFAALGTTFDQLGTLLGFLPLAFVLLAIAFVVRAARPILTELVRLPGLAAGWPASIARAATLTMVDNLWRELKATTLLFSLVFALATLGGLVVSLALIPATNLLLEQFAATLPHAQSGLAPISLLVVMLALALNLAVVVCSSALYLFRAQQILHGSFYERFTLRSHARFWIGGTLQLLWTWALVLGFWFAANAAIGPVLSSLGTSVYAALASSAVLVLGGLLGTFWLGRGFRALAFLAKYEIANDHEQTEPPLETNPGRRQRFLQLSSFPLPLAYARNSMQHTQNVSPLLPPERFPDATPAQPVPVPFELSARRTQMSLVPPIPTVIPSELKIEYTKAEDTEADEVDIDFEPEPPKRRRRFHLSGGISA